MWDELRKWIEGSGKECQEGVAHVYLWLIHVDVRQKPAQYYKAIIFQLKIEKF